MIKVFFYGLFMDVDILLRKGVHPQNITRATLDNYKLKIGKRATLVPATGSRVYGLLMSLSQPELDSLYADETVKAYRPEPVIVQTLDQSCAALCYNMTESEQQKDPEYVFKLKELTKKLRFPEEYVNSI